MKNIRLYIYQPEWLDDMLHTIYLNILRVTAYILTFFWLRPRVGTWIGKKCVSSYMRRVRREQRRDSIFKTRGIVKPIKTMTKKEELRYRRRRRELLTGKTSSW